jgi:sterol desaturase/sphingolipid hydroxylase (fatty acid hydroxylase superfamily)
MRHHFQDHRYGFGVSSPLWDVVFGTKSSGRPGRDE